MKIIGHRGARGLAPENTLASLRKAVEHNVDEVEFDLRVTKDCVVVLHHDRHMTDASGIRLQISTNKYDELKKHDPNLTTLEELLEARGSIPLYLEAKPRIDTRPVLKLLKDRDLKAVAIGSKSQKTLLKIHAALPEVPKIVIHPWSGVIASRRARQVGTKRISMNQLWLWSGYIRAVSKGGYLLSAYTLNDPHKAKRWKKDGLYGVVTDYPDLFEKS